jgi:TolB protein
MMMRTKPTVLATVLAGSATLAAGSLPSPFSPPAPIPEISTEALAPQDGAQTVIDVTLANPNFHPRLGIPDFASGGDAELQTAVRTAADVLWADLDFEKEFYLIPRTQSASIPAASTVEALPLARWSELGADYVIHASAARQGDEFSVDLRLVQVGGATPGRVLHSYRYQRCRLATPRACAHFIADDFHRQTRGLEGVAQTKLAFVSDRDAGRVTSRLIGDSGRGKEVYIADYDGFNPQRVTVTQSLTMGPAWAPDGRALAYTSWHSGFPDIYVNTLDGRPVSRPVKERNRPDDQNWLPAWSPDGTRLAFGSNRSGNNDVWVVNRDGSGLRNLTPNTPNSSDGAPAWSPDGTKIAFTSDRSGSTQIYIMNSADGLGVTRLTFEIHADRPTWSPLNFIAYTSGSGPGHTISIYSFNSTPPVAVVVDGVGDNGSPAIAPNGRHIAFTTSRWGREQIAIVNRRGENIRQITREGTNQSPSWSRPRRQAQ